MWHLYRNRYKSQWRYPPYSAAAIVASTIPELEIKLAKAHDGWKFGQRSIKPKE